MDVEYCRLSKAQVIKGLKDLYNLNSLKQIPGFPAYALSDCARVFYIDVSGLICYDCDKKHDLSSIVDALELSSEKDYSPEIFVGKNGYRQLYLYRGKKKTKHPKMIYKLMAVTYLEPRPSKKHLVRHLDGNCHNDAASNLAWGTHADNMEDLRKHREHRAKLTKELKAAIVKAVKKTKTVEERVALAQEFNVSFLTVNRYYWIWKGK